jgi:hypothetical protein
MRYFFLFFAMVATVCAQELKVAGSIFGKGFDQPYVFAGAEVRFYSREQAERDFQPQDVWRKLPEAVFVLRTGVDGRFAGTLPAGEWLLYVRETRRYKNGNSAGYEWRVKLWEQADLSNLVLDEANRHFFSGLGIRRRE